MKKIFIVLAVITSCLNSKLYAKTSATEVITDSIYPNQITIEDITNLIDKYLNQGENIEEPYIGLCPDKNHPHVIDLGLPSHTKWLCCNVGASSPEDVGGYYSWGETEKKDSYNRDNYSNCTSITDDNDVAFEIIDIADSLVDSNDIYNNGNDGIEGKLRSEVGEGKSTYVEHRHMPTQQEIEELQSFCEWEWVEYEGVYGAMITGKNGAKIFFPAAGFKDNENGELEVGTYGSYWGRDIGENMYNEDVLTQCGTELIFGIVDGNNGFNPVSFYYTYGKTGWCFCGRSVRAVSQIFKRPNEGVDYTHTSVTENEINTHWITIEDITDLIAKYLTWENEIEKTDTIETDTIEIDEPYFGICPDKNHPHVIDLGLSSGVKWLCCNIGASAPEDLGGYYSWGEVEEKDSYTLNNYSNCTSITDENDIALKYMDLWLNESFDNSECNEIIFSTPTQKQIAELQDSCVWTWEEYEGVMGAMVTGKNGAKIFLPAAGFKDNENGGLGYGTYGSYWGRDLGDNLYTTIQCGTELIFGIVDGNNGFSASNFYCTWGKTGWCFCGRSVRAVSWSVEPDESIKNKVHPTNA